MLGREGKLLELFLSRFEATQKIVERNWDSDKKNYGNPCKLPIFIFCAGRSLSRLRYERSERKAKARENRWKILGRHNFSFIAAFLVHS